MAGLKLSAEVHEPPERPRVTTPWRGGGGVKWSTKPFIPSLVRKRGKHIQVLILVYFVREGKKENKEKKDVTCHIFFFVAVTLLICDRIFGTSTGDLGNARYTPMGGTGHNWVRRRTRFAFQIK